MMRTKIPCVFILNCFVLIAGQADVELTFSKTVVTVTGPTSVNLRCEVKVAEVTEIRVTHGEANKLVAVSQKDVSDGVAQVDPKYVGKKVTGSVGEDLDYLQLGFPTVLCEDDGQYTCSARVKDGTVSSHSATLVVQDGLQKAMMTVTPDKSVKNASEGEKVEFRCQQIYGVIHPLDPRTKPRRVYWQWDYNKDRKGWVKINGALSIFENIDEPTKCDGQLYQSVMSLFPLQEKHSGATFRCYLVVNMAAVDDSLRGTYVFGKVGAPHSEGPMKQRYEYTTASMATFLIGFFGFIFALGASIFYFLNKRYHCFKKETVVPNELLAREDELTELEQQFNKALQADIQLHGAKGPPISEPPSSAVDDQSQADSSFVESSVAGSSGAESSVVESSVAESSAYGR